MSEVYLDNSATTRVCPEAVAKMTELMTTTYANPSSLHAAGIAAGCELEAAREAVAGALGCAAGEIVFTSGGTEANNLALFGAVSALRRRGNRIVTTAIEHPSVAEPLRRIREQGFELIELAPDAWGRVPAEAFQEAVTPETILVSVMHVGNETGAIQPVREAAAAIRRAGAPAVLHCDAVQSFGKFPFTPKALGADLLTLSSHKIHGPKGAGALYIRKGARVMPITFGGGQERALRPGTEPLPAIAGFAAAVQAIGDPVDHTVEVSALRAQLIAGLTGLDGVHVNSPPDGFPYIVSFSVPGIRAETLLHFLAARGVYVSSGSACSKGKRSAALLAQGLDPVRVDGALRVSFSRFSTASDVDRLLAAVREGLRSLAAGARRR